MKRLALGLVVGLLGGWTAARAFSVAPAAAPAARASSAPPIVEARCVARLGPGELDEIERRVTRALSASAPAPAALAAPEAVAAAPDAEAHAAASEARAQIDRAVAAGVWTAEDASTLRALLPRVPADERAQVLGELVTAVNAQRVRLTGRSILQSQAMGLLTFALNVTLDGCCDHRSGVADDALLRYYTRLMDDVGGMLFGRTTYELMEGAWPAIARDPKAPPAFRTWARKLEAKPKHVVSSTRRDFPWSNTFRVDGNLRDAIKALKRRTPRGLLVGSPMLSAALQELGLIDEYRVAVHPVLAGHGPTLFAGLGRSARLTLVGTKRLKSGVMALHYRKS